MGKYSHIGYSWRKQVRENYEVGYEDSLRNELISNSLTAAAVDAPLVICIILPNENDVYDV